MISPDPDNPRPPKAAPGTAPTTTPLYRFLSHTLRSPLTTIVAVLQQGLQRPAESPGHPRFEKVLQQTQKLLQQLDDFNQTLLAPPNDTPMQETLLENLLYNACDRVRPQATARQQALQLQVPAVAVFVPHHNQSLVQAVVAMLQWTMAQAPQAATITLHCTLQPHSSLLHIGYSAPQNPHLPSSSITHTLYLPTLVYDCAF